MIGKFKKGMNKLLKALCRVHSPSGEEVNMKQFLLNYINEHSHNWNRMPQIITGEDFQDCLIMIFGEPTVAAFAHMDSTGFTVRYQNQLISIGGPEVIGGEILRGVDEFGEIECRLELNEAHQLHYNFGRAIRPGTSLVFKNNYIENDAYITSPYLDNRVGIYNLLKVAETMKNGAIVFSAWEEHGGGSVPYLVKYLYENYRIRKTLISDVTWISDGININEGVVISYRDNNIPRKSFLKSIDAISLKNNIEYQIEVEAAGSSDAREIQLSPYPIDWCFIGPPVKNAHSSYEKISKKDLDITIGFYAKLMDQL